MNKKELRIHGQDGKLSTEKDDHSQFPFTAIFETETIGTLYGYGRTKQEAIKDLKEEVEILIEMTE